jgi:general secretion pathway protein G
MPNGRLEHFRYKCGPFNHRKCSRSLRKGHAEGDCADQRRRESTLRGRMMAGKGTEAGFTLLELMIVMLIVAILAAVAIPAYLASIKAAKEAVLKEDLHVMRGAIDAYTADKEKAPQSLDDLVQGGYLKKLPIDPMTHSDTTWITATDDTLQNIDQTEAGVNDVHSGSEDTGSDGQPYSSW